MIDINAVILRGFEFSVYAFMAFSIPVGSMVIYHNMVFYWSKLGETSADRED